MNYTNVPLRTTSLPLQTSASKISKSKLFNSLQKHLLQSPSTKDVTKLTNRLIDEINSQPTGIIGQRIVRQAPVDDLPLHHLIFEKDSKGERVSILITPNLPELARGSGLVAYQAQLFTIPLNGGEIEYSPKVFKTINSNNLINGKWYPRNAEQLKLIQNQVMNGLENHKKLLLMNTVEKVHLSALPMIIGPPNMINPLGGGPLLELMQTMYNGNLSNTLYPPSGAPKDNLNLSDILMMSENIAKTLDQIHQNGYVHRDVRPENILRDFTSPSAHLSDFDTLNKIGAALDRFKGQAKSYPFSDRCGQEDIPTPLTDTYGLVASILSIVAPQLNGTVINTPKEYLDDPIKKSQERTRSIEFYVNKVLAIASENQSSEFRSNLKWVFSQINDHDIKKNENLINQFIKQNDSKIPSKVKDILEDLPDNIQVILAIFDTFAIAYLRSEQTWEFLKANPEIQRDIAIDIEKVPPQNKLEAQSRKARALAILERYFITMRKIMAWLKSLVEAIKSRKQQRKQTQFIE